MIFEPGWLSLGYREGVAPGQAPARPEEKRPTRSFPNMRRRTPAHPIDSVVEGERVATPHGECFVALRRHSAGHPHGCYRLDDALEADPQALAWAGKDPRLAGLDLSHAPSWTRRPPAWPEAPAPTPSWSAWPASMGRGFAVDQYFMEDYDGEEALLQALADALEPVAAGASFNGNAFDIPLLESRWPLARRPLLPEAAHLDLLHYAPRRLWRGRLESCALGRLEEAVPGGGAGSRRARAGPSQASTSTTCARRDARPLVPVFEHNRPGPPIPGHPGPAPGPPVRRSLPPGRGGTAGTCVPWGAAFEDLDLPERAIACYERATAAGHPAPRCGRTAMMRLGMAYKRMRQREDAAGRCGAALAGAQPRPRPGGPLWSWPSTSSTWSGTTARRSGSPFRPWRPWSCGLPG